MLARQSSWAIFTFGLFAAACHGMRMLHGLITQVGVIMSHFPRSAPADHPVNEVWVDTPEPADLTEVGTSAASLPFQAFRLSTLPLQQESRV